MVLRPQPCFGYLPSAVCPTLLADLTLSWLVMPIGLGLEAHTLDRHEFLMLYFAMIKQGFCDLLQLHTPCCIVAHAPQGDHTGKDP